MIMKSYLQALMDEAGITQGALAKALGMAPGTIGRLQRNHFDRIDNDTIKALCKYFGLTSVSQLVEIVWEDGDQPGAGALAEDEPE